MSKDITLSGWLKIGDYGEDYKCLLLDDESLVDNLKDLIDRKCVSVQYYLSTNEVTEEQAVEQWLQTLYGQANAEYLQRYSEITGYLWTDSDLNIGGHDLEDELRSQVMQNPMYLIMKIQIHGEANQ